MSEILTREQRIERKKKELENLKAQLKKSKSQFHSHLLRIEIQAVAKELYDLIEKP